MKEIKDKDDLTAYKVGPIKIFAYKIGPLTILELMTLLAALGLLVTWVWKQF
jgi:hypothetical protein